MTNEVINVDVYKNFKCTAYNPYGFWTISKEEGGVVPKALQGQFTSLVDCHTAVDAYEVGHKNELTPNQKAEVIKAKALKAQANKEQKEALKEVQAQTA